MSASASARAGGLVCCRFDAIPSTPRVYSRYSSHDRSEAAVGALAGAHRAFDADEVLSLARRAPRPSVRVLPTALAMVGRRPRRRLVLDLRVLRRAVLGTGRRGARATRDAGRRMVSRGAGQ